LLTRNKQIATNNRHTTIKWQSETRKQINLSYRFNGLLTKPAAKIKAVRIITILTAFFVVVLNYNRHRLKTHSGFEDAFD
jgi:hypothetical protein